MRLSVLLFVIGCDAPTIAHRYTCTATINCDGRSLEAPMLEACVEDGAELEQIYRDQTRAYAKARCEHPSFPTWCETSPIHVCFLPATDE